MSRSPGASTALQQGARPRRRHGPRSSSPSRGARTSLAPQASSTGRLRSLLTVLVITTLLLIVLQSYRAFYGPVRLGKRAAQARPSSVGTVEADDSWRSYLSTMRKHFDEQISQVKEVKEDATQKRGAPSTGGMAPIAGEGVRDHPVEKKAHADTASEEDRRVALEDIDQDTLKAMYDALHEAGVRM